MITAQRRAILLAALAAVGLGLRAGAGSQWAFMHAVGLRESRAYFVLEWNDVHESRSIGDILLGEAGSWVRTSYDYYCVAVDFAAPVSNVVWAQRLPGDFFRVGMRVLNDDTVVLFTGPMGIEGAHRSYRGLRISSDGVREILPPLQVDPADKYYLTLGGELYRVREGRCYLRDDPLRDEVPVDATPAAVVALSDPDAARLAACTVRGWLSTVGSSDGVDRVGLFPVCAAAGEPRSVRLPSGIRGGAVVGLADWPVAVCRDTDVRLWKCLDLTSGTFYARAAGSRTSFTEAFAAGGERRILSFGGIEASRTGFLRRKTIRGQFELLTLPSGGITKHEFVFPCP
jgi:hypothetical protein